MAAPGMLSREGVTGLGGEPLPKNRRERKAQDLHPWKVFGFTQGEDVDHCFEIFIPEGLVHVGEEALTIEGIAATAETGYYTIDCEEEIEGDGSFMLAVTTNVSTTGVGARPVRSAKIIASEEEIDEEAEILAILPIAKVSRSTEGDYPSGAVVRQLIRSAVAFPSGGSGDNISIGLVTDEEAADPSALQIKDFDNEESDGQQGLAERLKIVKDGEGYKIEANEGKATVHILARVNGKIKYIPLTGADEPDEDEENEESAADPCEHPGSKDGGGVSADDEDGVHGGAAVDASSEGGLGGGVSADDDTHEGNPCNSCNCD